MNKILKDSKIQVAESSLEDILPKTPGANLVFYDGDFYLSILYSYGRLAQRSW